MSKLKNPFSSITGDLDDDEAATNNRIDTIQLRPILGRGGNHNNTSTCAGTRTISLRLPVTLGRRDLARAWWKACPRNCQAWIPSSSGHAGSRLRPPFPPCQAHCRPVRLQEHLQRLSRSLIHIDVNGYVRITAKHDELVHWKGRKRFQRHSTKGQLSIGENPKQPWMAFSVTGICDPRNGDWKVASAVHKKRRQTQISSKRRLTTARRRIWFDDSSSSAASSSSSSSSEFDKLVRKSNKSSEGNNEGIAIRQHDKNNDCDNIKKDNRNKDNNSRKSIARVSQKRNVSSTAGRPKEDFPPIQRATSQKTDNSEQRTMTSSELLAKQRIKTPVVAGWVSKLERSSRMSKTTRWIDDDKDDHDDDVSEEIILPCQVVRRDYYCKSDSPTPPPIPRRVTPDEKRLKVLHEKLSPLGLGTSSSVFRRDSNVPLTQDASASASLSCQKKLAAFPPPGASIQSVHPSDSESSSGGILGSAQEKVAAHSCVIEKANSLSDANSFASKKVAARSNEIQSNDASSAKETCCDMQSSSKKVSGHSFRCTMQSAQCEKTWSDIESCDMLSLPGDKAGPTAAAALLSATSAATSQFFTCPEESPAAGDVRRRCRQCRDLRLSDWQEVHQAAHPESVLCVASEMVLAMNRGRRDDSPNLLLPSLLARDATILTGYGTKRHM